MQHCHVLSRNILVITHFKDIEDGEWYEIQQAFLQWQILFLNICDAFRALSLSCRRGGAFSRRNMKPVSYDDVQRYARYEASLIWWCTATAEIWSQSHMMMYSDMRDMKPVSYDDVQRFRSVHENIKIFLEDQLRQFRSLTFRRISLLP
jgi:hypothetical protein